MTGGELMVTIVFALLGYWIVSFFLQRKSTPSAQDAQPSAQTWPHVLNVDANASVDQIRAAYQALIGQHHPDDRKSKEITAAYREAMRSRDLGE